LTIRVGEVLPDLDGVGCVLDANKNEGIIDVRHANDGPPFGNFVKSVWARFCRVTAFYHSLERVLSTSVQLAWSVSTASIPMSR
jgi:hypothetical protein